MSQLSIHLKVDQLQTLLVFDISSGVGSIPTLSAVQATAGESFSFTQSFTQGDALVTCSTTGAVSAFSNQTSTAAGTAGH